MRRTLSGFVAFALVAGLLWSIGCSHTTAPKPTPGPWKTLGDKTDVISNLVLSYNKADIAHYVALLHTDYRFYNQSADVAYGEPEFRTRDWDIAATTNLFQAARGQYADASMNLDRLSLEIRDGSWMQVDTVPGLPAPCVDCWTTTREYNLYLAVKGGTVVYLANDLAQFIVVPVSESGKTLYKLYRVEDIAK